MIAVGSWDNMVHILNAQSGEQVYERHYNEVVNAVAWSPDGTYLAVGGDDDQVQIVNPRTDQVLVTYTGHIDRITAVAWSPNGQEVASGSDDTTVQVWNPFTGKMLIVYTEHHQAITTLAWSPDSTEIVSGSFDFTARVWKVTG
jgi:WD40 repeat protein